MAYNLRHSTTDNTAIQSGGPGSDTSELSEDTTHAQPTENSGADNRDSNVPRASPEHRPSPSVDPQSTPLMDLLARLTNKVTASSEPSDKGPEARKPDTFDGHDRTKLRDFLRQCRVVFLTHEHRFRDDRKKILYCGSYLTGVAAKWFEPYIGGDSPLLNNWPLFSERLVEMFGEPDEVASAERKLQQLRMRHNDKVAEYITSFRTFSSIVDWNDQALKFQFRQGLADRIKDQLMNREAPIDTYQELQDAALEYDSRYWQRMEERHRYAPVEPSYTERSSLPERSGGRTNRPPRRNSPFTKSVFPPKDNRPQRDSRPPYRGNPPTDLGNKLTNSGNLKDNEKARRMEKGLCLYCGGGDHQLANCKKRPNNSASGRSAQTYPRAGKA